MTGPVVAIGGPPGSGKSTAGRIVAERLGLEFRSAGEAFRAAALEHGMDVEAFGHFAEAHPDVDRGVDERMQSLAARGGVVIDGRIQGVLCRRRGIPAVYVLVTADRDERVRRVAQRDHQTLEDARRRVADREESERERYRRFYGIDLDEEPPDLALDSTHRPPDGVADAIVAFVQGARGRPG